MILLVCLLPQSTWHEREKLLVNVTWLHKTCSYLPNSNRRGWKISESLHWFPPDIPILVQIVRNYKWYYLEILRHTSLQALIYQVKKVRVLANNKLLLLPPNNLILHSICAQLHKLFNENIFKTDVTDIASDDVKGKVSKSKFLYKHLLNTIFRPYHTSYRFNISQVTNMWYQLVF